MWNPAPRHGNWETIINLESVQRSFTRMIDGIGLLPYSERLEILGLTTLGERRCRGDLIETYKIVNETVNYGQNLFNVSRHGSRLLSSLKSNKSS